MDEDHQSRLWFRQLLSGRDFATADPVAHQMRNFAYALGDTESHEAVIVDPAYDVAGLAGIVAEAGMRLVGVLATHFHADHIGGDLMGYGIEGIAALLEIADVPVHVQESERPWIVRAAGVGADNLAVHGSGDVVTVGRIGIELLHTPGHTPGSQCFLVEDRLIAGDTLFLDGCGRTDLPGSDPAAMYDSLTNRLARVPDTATLYPGHLYSPEPSAPMGETRRRNYVFRPKSVDDWLALFGG